MCLIVTENYQLFVTPGLAPFDHVSDRAGPIGVLTWHVEMVVNGR
jgi:hypothetical protein